MLTSLYPKHWRLELIILTALAFFTRLWSVLTPREIVFDEVYFKVFAAHYLDGHYFFDIHPPLAKLILASWAHLMGLTPAAMLTDPVTVLRWLPAIAGAVLVPVFWLLLRRLGASRPFAFLGATALLLDNALLVESRFILMDSMLLLFGIGALTAYLVARPRHGASRWLWLMAAAVLGGAAVSTKWTGLTALGLIGLLWLADQRGSSRSWGRRLGELAILGTMPVLIYVGSFWLHFQLMPHSGDGDAFMSSRFQQTLAGNSQYNPNTKLGFGDKFLELNAEMYQANQTLTASHPYGSRWYTWPLELRPIYYWAGQPDQTGRQGNIYLLGNPVVWWGILVAVASGAAYAWTRRTKLRATTKAALALTGGAYLMNFVPFMGVPRVMFLYHYFFSFLFSLAFAILLWNDLAASRDGHHQLRTPGSRGIYVAIIAAIVVGFWYFLPLTYGTPLSPGELLLRMWLPSWR